MIGEQLARGEDHAGRAEAALQGVVIPESLLERIELAVLSQPFDGEDLAPFRLDGEHGTTFHSHTVEHDGAGSTDGGLAADVGAGKSGDLAEEVDQQEARFYLTGIGFPVDLE